jgi:hypothetical protein
MAELGHLTRIAALATVLVLVTGGLRHRHTAEPTRRA